jgi:hypothetical protein
LHATRLADKNAFFKKILIVVKWHQNINLL